MKKEFNLSDRMSDWTESQIVNVKEAVKREKDLINNFRIELENELMSRDISESSLRMIHFKINGLKRDRNKIFGDKLV